MPQEPQAETSPIAAFIRANSWVYLVAVLVIGGLIGGGYYLSTRPAQGSWRYGVCRALMDFEFAYPTTFDILSVTEERAGTRFFMAEKNPFGNERIIQVDCEYRIKGDQISLARILFDRKPIPAMRVAKYNRMLPVLLSMKDLDTDLPPELPRALSQLKR